MILHGLEAVKALERELDCTLSYKQRRVVMLEGYATEPYLDTKGIVTTGVGQTGQWIQRGFKAAFLHHLDRAEARFPDFSRYPEFIQGEILQAEYRGDWGHSPKTTKLIKERKFTPAAHEFLDSAEYREGNIGISRRMEAVSLALRLYGLQELG